MKEKIRLLLEESMQFNANDLLVNTSVHALLKLNETQIFPLNAVKQLLKKAQEIEKESGVNPLCASKGSIHWKLKLKEENEVVSPLFLQSCTAKIDKVKSEVRFELSEESFINPFVLAHLRNEFDIQFNGSDDDLFDFLKVKGFTNVDFESRFLGNFHPHRYEQIRELDHLLSLESSPVVNELLGGDKDVGGAEISLTSYKLYPSDPDQNLVFKAIENSNVVVQGPPGTGKSQVLTNLLAKLVDTSATSVLVSEKRVALEVIQRKFSELGLQQLCYVSDYNASSKEFISALKSTWSQLENQKENHVVNLLLSEQVKARLQMRMDLLNDKSLFGGVGFTVFSEILGNKSLEVVAYRSDAPMLREIMELETVLKRIFAEKINYAIASIKASHFKNGTVKSLDIVVKDLLADLSLLRQNFFIDSFLDLEKAMKDSAICQFFETDSFKNFEQLYQAKEREKFLKLYKQWLEVQNEVALQKEMAIKWLKEPSFLELKLLQEMAIEASFWAKRKFRKVWKDYSSFPIENAQDLLINRKNQLNILEKAFKLDAKLLAIGAPTDASSLQSLYLDLQKSELDKFEIYRSIPSNDRQKMTSNAGKLNHLFHTLRLYFSFEPTQNVESLLQTLLDKHVVILKHSADLENASPQLLKSLGCSSSFDDLLAISLKAAQLEFNLQFPQHADLSPKKLLEDCEQIINLEKEEGAHFALRLLQAQKDKFERFHELLRTASTKLSSEEKELKSKLKRGKAILVKEFARSRNFPTLRSLFATDARVWIQILKPIWLCNPTQMARCFPMEKGIFDVAIFDEASQIPLQNSLGTIYRAKRVLVAGDSQQMGPSAYFKAQSAEMVDVLHQATYHYKNVALHHHYRSEDAALISFSNTHFYRGELLTFPASDLKEQAMVFHYCDEAIYENRKNEKEAIQVARQIEAQLTSPQKLGIVAFSETQLEEILKQMTKSKRAQLEQRLEEDSAFIKALENIQGDECDYLIVSFGYGKDREGAFHHRFGPINGKNGGKRLNVLLTRARKRIDFFASVRSCDFQISKNENIELLRKYLYYIEKGEFAQTRNFPYGLQPVINGSNFTIGNVQDKIKNAEELVTLVNVLQHRKWNINFV